MHTADLDLLPCHSGQVWVLIGVVLVLSLQNSLTAGIIFDGVSRYPAYD